MEIAIHDMLPQPAPGAMVAGPNPWDGDLYDAPRPPLRIRPAARSDEEAIWKLIRPATRTGAIRPLPRDLSRRPALRFWLAADRRAFVAEEKGRIVGAHHLGPSQAGAGRHVASLDYAVDADAAARGIDADLIEHAILEARALNYLALQLDCVVATDMAALRLCRAFHFDAVGRIPRAFRHPALGFVDRLIMHRFL